MTATIDQLKELETPDTPLFLVDCTLISGEGFHWSTHNVAFNGQAYAGRILKHNLFELSSSSTEATDGVTRVSLSLANADSFLSAIERTVGWKGAQVTIQFVFFDLLNGVAASESQVLFRGAANPPDESTESYLTLSFTNRLILQRSYLPEVRIQKRCPWIFPSSASQLVEAVSGGNKGRYSPFYRCGYSAGVTGGVGNLDTNGPYTTCDYSRIQCEQRGMFDTDSSGNINRRFGAIEFVPASSLVRGYGEKGSHWSVALDNQARYNDFAPLVYGTAWYLPPIVYAWNDGNLTRMEVLLGMGVMSAAVKVIVNGIEIPEGIAGANMTATGWYGVVTFGTRAGAFNTDFENAAHQPLGDPYGSMAYLSVVVPNRISDGRSLPQVAVLAQGMVLSRYDATGAYMDESSTNNSAWVLLDILLRSGWAPTDLDLASFAAVAARCDDLVSVIDLNGNTVLRPRFQCNLVLSTKRSVADIARGIRTAAGLYLRFNALGLLQLVAEDSLAVQQLTKPAGSNSREKLDGGWPAYEFGDNAFSGILRRDNGQPSFSTTARSTADCPNLFTVEFQDELNDYQQDSLTLVDLDDTLRANQQVTAALTALGLPNFDQATRITSLQLNKSVYGNMYVDFETSVRAVDLRPGDIITVTYAKEGWDRQPFRITRIAPGANYRTAAITAQIHDDAWYEGSGQGSAGPGRQAGFAVNLPRPLIGTKLDENGVPEFDVAETTIASTDGSVSVQLAVGFVNPVKTTSGSNGVPLVGLDPVITTTGGTLNGGQNQYYAVTGVDAAGVESALSFIVKAVIPAGTDTNQVTLPTLSFAPNATCFDVYRGTTPAQLTRVALNLPLASSYSDSGSAPTLAGPPDINYDHANFYWRLELQPEEPVDIHSAFTVGNSTLGMLPGDYISATVRILNGLGIGQERSVAGNTVTTLTVTTRWDIEPDATSTFVVSDASWQFGATAVVSPVTFEVPNRQGITVQISGLAANVRNEECAYELSPLTRWRIEGDGGSLLDGDVPPAPVFGVSAIGQGTIQVSAISLGTLDNTRSIAAGTLTLGFWDEVGGMAPSILSASLDAVTLNLLLTTAVSVNSGDLIQIDNEIVLAGVISADGLTLPVTRGVYGTTASTHASSAAAYLLEKKTFVMPFAREFFGSLASGSYAFSAFLPDVRIGTAELFLTNSKGNSDVTRKSFTSTTSSGLRTLSGGQMTIQLEGVLAIQTNAAPPLTMEATHSARDVFANISIAPTGAPIVLRVTQSGLAFCTLTIPVGSTVSNIVDGFALGALQAKSLIGLDIVSLTQVSDTTPGNNLTVTIRL